MHYWTGPLLTREQLIEKRRAALRRELLGLDCLTELIPLLNALPEVGDYSHAICGDFDELRKRVAKFVTDNWPPQDCFKVLACLDKWCAKRTLPVKAKMVLCEDIPQCSDE